jgi:hypothetical protein
VRPGKEVSEGEQATHAPPASVSYFCTRKATKLIT